MHCAELQICVSLSYKSFPLLTVWAAFPRCVQNTAHLTSAVWVVSESGPCNCDVIVWIWRQNLCFVPSIAVAGNYPAWQPRGWLKRWAKCASLCTFFQKAFGPITFEWIIVKQPNFYHGLPFSTVCLMQNDDPQNLILFTKNAPMCAWVRLSFPYYRVRIEKLTSYSLWETDPSAIIFSAYCCRQVFMALIFLYISGCVNIGSSISLWPFFL